MGMHPTFDGALRLVATLRDAPEVHYEGGVLHVPHDHTGAVRAEEVVAPASPKHILFSGFDASEGAIALFDLGLKASGTGYISTHHAADRAGDQPTITVNAPDGFQSHQVQDGIRDAVRQISQGWAKDGDGYLKIFPANDPTDRTNIAQDRQGQRAVINAIVNPDPSGPDVVKAIFLDAKGNRLGQEDVANWDKVKQIALRITTQHAALLKSELGISIGITK